MPSLNYEPIPVEGFEPPPFVDDGIPPFDLGTEIQLPTKVCRVRRAFTQDDADQLIQERLNEFAAKQKVTIDEAIKQAGVTTIELKRPSQEQVSTTGLFHKALPKLIKLMQMRKIVYILGPTGSGKSHGVRQAAKILGLPFYFISLNPQSSPTRVEGYMTPGGDYIATNFRRAYNKGNNGGVFLADEIDNSSANLWTSFQSTIDSVLGSFPDGMVERDEDFVFVGTGNTNLSGDAVYRDRKALDKATIARFIFLYWDYDEAMERTITQGHNTKALPWVNWVHRIRAYSKQHNPQMYAYTHPRVAYEGAAMLREGFTVDEVADMTMFKWSFDGIAKKAALEACPLPAEDMR